VFERISNSFPVKVEDFTEAADLMDADDLTDNAAERMDSARSKDEPSSSLNVTINCIIYH
jgi:hypothetical protein